LIGPPWRPERARWRIPVGSSSDWYIYEKRARGEIRGTGKNWKKVNADVRWCRDEKVIRLWKELQRTSWRESGAVISEVMTENAKGCIAGRGELGVGITCTRPKIAEMLMNGILSSSYKGEGDEPRKPAGKVPARFAVGFLR